MIGPIRGNSWRLLISLSLRLRVPGSVLRQLPANRDMDLFHGAAKGPYTFRDLDRSADRSSVPRYRDADFLHHAGPSVKKCLLHGNISRGFRLPFRCERRTKEGKLKRTRMEELLTDFVKYGTCFWNITPLDDSKLMLVGKRKREKKKSLFSQDLAECQLIGGLINTYFAVLFT